MVYSIPSSNQAPPVNVKLKIETPGKHAFQILTFSTISGLIFEVIGKCRREFFLIKLESNYIRLHGTAMILCEWLIKHFEG